MPTISCDFPSLLRLQSNLKNSSSGDNDNEGTLKNGVLAQDPTTARILDDEQE